MIQAMKPMFGVMLNKAFETFKSAVENDYKPAVKIGEKQITAEMIRSAAREGAQTANKQVDDGG